MVLCPQITAARWVAWTVQLACATVLLNLCGGCGDRPLLDEKVRSVIYRDFAEDSEGRTVGKMEVALPETVEAICRHISRSRPVAPSWVTHWCTPGGYLEIRYSSGKSRVFMMQGNCYLRAGDPESAVDYKMPVTIESLLLLDGWTGSRDQPSGSAEAERMDRAAELFWKQAD